MLPVEKREPRGFAFVQFLDPYEAAEAQYRMNGQLFAGREISVVVAAETRKRPDDMRRRTRTGRGPSGYEGQRSSYYGRSRSRSRSRSPRYPSGSRSRRRSRSYSPAPRRRNDYSHSSERRKDPRSPRDPPPEEDARHARRSYSPSSRKDAADRNAKDYADRPAYESDGAGTHWKLSPGRAIRSPSGSRSRSADISPRQSR
ncbi:hypothetical protein AgCh_035358 [Apium graveolens]